RSVQRPGTCVVGDLGVDVQVGRAVVDELQVRQRRGALGEHPLVELAPHRPVGTVVLGGEAGPAGTVVDGETGEDRRDVRALHLERVARDDPYERDTGGDQGGEA